MDESSQTNRFAPPTAVVEDVERVDDNPRLASRRDRFSASVVDSVLNVVVVTTISVLFGLDLFRSGDSTSAGHSAVRLAVGATVFFAIHGYLLATQGQTLGKKLTGVRIVRTDGQRVQAGRLMLRYGIFHVVALVPMVMMLYALLDALAIFRSSRKCLHDSIADTIVVKA